MAMPYGALACTEPTLMSSIDFNQNKALLGGQNVSPRIVVPSSFLSVSLVQRSNNVTFEASPAGGLRFSGKKGGMRRRNLCTPFCMATGNSSRGGPIKISSQEFKVSSSQLIASPEPQETVRRSGWNVLPDIWKTTAEKYGDLIALHDPHRSPSAEVTFRELEQYVLDFAEGLRVFGVKQGDCVSLFSDNSHRWIVADQGIMTVGACDAVRGAKAPPVELVNIAIHSESSVLVVESEELLMKLAPTIRESPELQSRLSFAVVLWTSSKTKSSTSATSNWRENLPFPVHTYEELMGAGRTSRQALAAAERNGHSGARHQQQLPDIRPDDVATIVYTSGTSGNAKGVMLTHRNLMTQVSQMASVIRPDPSSSVLSLLPPWHMYERSCEYLILSCGAKQVYSGVKTFKEDLSKFPPDYFIAVPLVFDILYKGVQTKLAEGSAVKVKVANTLVSASLIVKNAVRILRGEDLSKARSNESLIQAVVQWVAAAVVAALLYPLHLLAVKLVYSKVRAALGIKKVAVSGGGSLPPHVDKFFEGIGMVLLNGYGLTETSPVLTARKPFHNVLGSVGVPLPGTEIRVVDLETGKVVPPGVKGLVKARGPQLMKGYYRNPAATANAIDDEGFFNTGDVGWVSPAVQWGSARNCGGQLVLEGRAKDTIVLASGENVEPGGIEEAALQSKLVQQVMLVGQDQRKLGALIVLNPDSVEQLTKEREQQGEQPPTADELQMLLRKDLNKCLSAAGCIHEHERIGPFVILGEAFTVENGLLTPTMKMKREAIATKHASEISKLYAGRS
eukprot:TRINITY_DN402_c0_g2_i1.p1 TRINITY_DN402_c0_g2~~TRINITY_DN402_c0_g2_i1.p1  ORF type:complete len:791 (+),score=156.45 TRINITY_DN402_c0_g2_i1:455-2827(+)